MGSSWGSCGLRKFFNEEHCVGPAGGRPKHRCRPGGAVPYDPPGGLHQLHQPPTRVESQQPGQPRRISRMPSGAKAGKQQRHVAESHSRQPASRCARAPPSAFRQKWQRCCGAQPARRPGPSTLAPPHADATSRQRQLRPQGNQGVLVSPAPHPHLQGAAVAPPQRGFECVPLMIRTSESDPRSQNRPAQRC